MSANLKVMQRTVLIGLVVLGLLLRLVFSLIQDHNITYVAGSGDAGWYLSNAYTLVTGQERGEMDIDLSRLTTPPLFLVFIGVPQAFFPLETAVIVIRITQAVLGVLTCFFAYHIALRLTGSQRAALFTFGALAVSPAFIIESAQITSETLFMFFVAGGLWLYIKYMSVGAGLNTEGIRPAPTFTTLVTVGILLGLATLTRAVFLLFPLGLAIHLLIVYRGRDVGRGVGHGIKRALILLAVYAAVVSTWTFYSLARWDRFVIAGEGLPAFLYVGAAGWDDPSAVDQALLEQLGETGDDPRSLTQGDFVEGAVSTISSDPLGYLRRRVTELAGAYLQPHGTTYFSGASLRELMGDWFTQDRSLSGLTALTQADHFWSKLVLYAFHFAALALGLIGVWRRRRNWRVSLPLIGYIGYTTLIHLVLLALPRYLFPTMICWYVFAGAAFIRKRV